MDIFCDIAFFRWFALLLSLSILSPLSNLIFCSTGTTSTLTTMSSSFRLGQIGLCRYYSLDTSPTSSITIFSLIIIWNILSHYNLKYSLSLTPCLVSFANQFNIIENSNILSTQKCQVPRQSDSSSGESVVRVSFNKHKRNASWEEPSCQVDADNHSITITQSHNTQVGLPLTQPITDQVAEQAAGGAR